MFIQQATSQDSGSTYDKVLHFPDKLFKKVTDKSNDIDHKLTARTEKYLDRLAKEERKLKKKLARKDSAEASKIFDDKPVTWMICKTNCSSTIR